MLTIHQLEVFVVVADEMSVRRAAERLNVTQPAVSASLAALQRELGAELIERDGRGIRLTAAGKALFRYASVLLGLVDETVGAVRAADAHVHRPIRIGATSSLVTHVIAPILTRMRDADPDASFTLEVDTRSGVWKQLANHETDVAVSSSPPSTQPFVTVATMPNTFVVVARPGTVWAGHLADVTWLIREEGATTRAASDEVIARLGIQPPTMVIGSDDAIRGSVEAGLGIGVLATDVVANAVKHRSLVTIKTPATPLSQPWHLVVRRGDTHDRRVMSFVSRIVAGDSRFEWTPAGLDARSLPDDA